jgi:hypothetical protein
MSRECFTIADRCSKCMKLAKEVHCPRQLKTLHCEHCCPCCAPKSAESATRKEEVQVNA